MRIGITFFMFSCLFSLAFASFIPRGRIEEVVIHSPSLEGNPLGNPVTKPLTVYLPPGYDENPAQRYPVIYHLHGAVRIGDESFANAGSDFVVKSGSQFIDRLVSEGKTKGAILVGVDGRTKDGCSLYVNSATNGNYADYICKDIVNYVDKNYRTIPQREYRGIIGYSAGGYGAMYLGMTHSDLFGSIVCLSPGSTLAASAYFDDWAKSKPQPDDGAMDGIEIDMARAFWPNPNNPPLYFDWPFTRDGELIKEVSDRVNDKIPELLIPHYKRELRHTAIYLGCGVDDWALKGARKFHELLTNEWIPHVYREYEGGHGDKAHERVCEGLEFLIEMFASQ